MGRDEPSESVHVKLDAVRPLRLADIQVDGELWPVLSFAIEHPDGLVLVDTGMVDSTPGLDAEWAPRLNPWPELGPVAAVINTHLHFDHCGGNRRFAGTPTYVQRAELDAVAAPEYLVEWARFDGDSYVTVDGDTEVLPGISVLLTPSHTPGHQAVVVDTEDGLLVLAGDMTHSRKELIEGGQTDLDRVHGIGARRVWISHDLEPWDREE
jgi:N-acyl homoserine lactone hydrolase